MGIAMSVVDAFSERPFAGNPAGVCFPGDAADAAWMQAVAREMNQAETAFVQPRPGGDGFGLRWFTPTVEMPLCGHATLASAHVLWETGRLPEGAVARFHTLSGWLTCKRAGEWIEMDFPSIASTPVEPPAVLLDALRVPRAAVRWAGHHELGYLLELAGEAEVRAVRPVFGALGRVPAKVVCVTAAAPADDYDFVSRVFGPAVGIDEDPVTGGAHCFLAPYWASKLGKQQMTGYQASARGGIVRVRPQGDRVLLGGRAVTVLRGELT